MWHQRPGVRPYVAAFVIDTAASAMFFVALAWVIVHSTDSAWVTAALLGLESVPRALLLIAGGLVGDRLGLLRTARWTLAVRILLAAGFGGVLLLDANVRLIPLIAVTLIFGLVDALHMPSIDGLRGLVVTDEEDQEQLTATIGWTTQVIEVAAAPVAGALVVLTGGVVGWTMLALLLLARALLGLVVRSGSVESIRGETVDVLTHHPRAFTQQLAQGLQVVRGDRTVGALLLIFMLGNMASTAPLIAGIPLKAKEFGWSGAVFGVATLGFSLGAAAGAFAYSHAARRVRDRLRSGVLAMLGASIAFAALAVSTAPWQVTSAAIGGGIALSFAAQTFIAHITTATPTAHLGFVTSLRQAAIFGGIPIGFAIYGTLAAALDVPRAGLVMTCGLALVSVVALVTIPARAPDARPSQR
ncbi:MFS transporter [Calidifontibacter indicus]|uniref:MFS transporter n=1 Tax=Calidifontibacter indicus TaxID=419650 RepID=A0A3D9U570_9MICO|nr:MFS transporter [Calidifontibacter indicus]